MIEGKEGGAQKLAEVLPLQGTLKDGTEVSLGLATEEHHSALRAILNGIIEDGNISPPLYQAPTNVSWTHLYRRSANHC